MALLQPTQFGDGGSNSGSLRDQILQANSSPEDDIIELQGGATYSLSIGNTVDNPDGETIDFGDGNTTDAETITFADENQGRLGDLDIIDSGSLTIRVVGEGQATIDASNIPEGDRVIDIQENANVTLENIVITGGNKTNPGGGISARDNSSVIISNSTISENTGVGGGGIALGGEITITDSQINNNSASEPGGGIAITSNGIANISGSTISNNSSINSADIGSGGGIFSNGQLNIADSIISENTASRQGGGVVLDSTTSIPSK